MLSWGGRSTVVWFLGSHSVDLVRWLFDDEVKRVYSVSRSRVLKQRGLDTPDFFHTILEMEGGGVAHVENCWIMSDSMPTVFDFKLELCASEGTLLADVSSHRMAQQFNAEGGTYLDVIGRTQIQGRAGGFAVNSILHFADCVVNDTEPVVTGEDGLKNTEVLIAIHESARSGEPVEIE
ncbi:MAG: Gfo/Idh/MocA family oxidoreductase, partial [Armatimonadetes bacterium]|nr:Gfo/Idh/MocA family oxidoreductase [Armatimonadota bacterium]